MTTSLVQSYQWASGFNNAAGLVAVALDVPTFNNMPFYVHSLGSWDDGILRNRADKTLGRYGYQRLTWIADVMSDTQYNYIQAKSPGGNGFSVKMTIRTLTQASAFANYSAVLHLPKKSELNRIWDAYRSVPLLFIIEAAL